MKGSAGIAKDQKQDFPGDTVDRNPPAGAGDTDSLLGPERCHVPQSN